MEEIDLEGINRELKLELQLLHGNMRFSENFHIKRYYIPEENALNLHDWVLEYLPLGIMKRLGIKKLYISYHQLIDEELIPKEQKDFIEGLKQYKELEELNVHSYDYNKESYSNYVHIFKELTHIKRLDLKYRGDDGIPSEIIQSMPNLEIIDMRENAVKVLKKSYFKGLVNLKELYFSDGYIEEIEVGAFDDLVSLEILHLDENNLKQLPHGLLDNLRNLRELSFYDNGINEFSSKLFNNLENLVLLNIDINYVNKMENDTFNNLNNLEILKVTIGKTQKPPENLLQGLTKLKELDLYCNTKEFPTDYFSHLHHLEILRLAECGLEFLPVLEGLEKLKEIDLEINPITQLYSNSFRTLVNLKKLRLTGTKFEALPDDVFSSLKNLEFLELYHNKLVSLKTNQFAGLDEKCKINLGGSNLPLPFHKLLYPKQLEELIISYFGE